MNELDDNVIEDILSSSDLKQSSIVDPEQLRTLDSQEPGASKLSGVSKVIQSLAESGADRFDPVRFCYIESMARRALEQRESVTPIVEKKAQDALAYYQADFAQAREDAESVVAEVLLESPEASAKIQRLFEACDFKGVARLGARLTRDRKYSNFTALTEKIIQEEFGDAPQGSAPKVSFDDMLRQQEDEVVESFFESAPEVESSSTLDSKMKPSSARRNYSGNNTLGELKSARLFRESLGKRSSDKLVTQAIKEGPEKPGPINPQMLVTRTLATIRDLSPDYLNRFVSYIDTILWLEQAGKNLESAASRKANGSKQKKGRAEKS